MLDDELLACRKVTPEIAARYLQGEMPAQEIRVRAQNDACPFCKAVKVSPGSSRFTYRINVGTLMAFKRGEVKT